MHILRGLTAAALLAACLAGSPLTPAGAERTDGEGGADSQRFGAAPADRVSQAAQRYGTTAAAVREQLAADPTLRLAPNGAAYFVDPVPAREPVAAPAPERAFPLSETFQLHSKPGSLRTIYLDFDGHTVSGTYWNTIPGGVGLPDGAHPAWDPAADGAAFSDGEKLTIQDIWQRVAEDFAPFDVDVTTEEPPLAAIDRAGAGDQTYGTRALITPSAGAIDRLCGGACGGVAFVSAFDQYPGHRGYADSHAEDQPAWVFPQALGDDPKNVAEATTHEVGHNLGLEHDGTSTQGYYEGHGGWAPIMGVGYSQPIVQWALSDYPDADLGGPEGGEFQPNPDDLATIHAHGALERADEPGTGTADAGPVPATGYISSRADRDFYALGACSGTVTVDADPAPISPNLDLELQLIGPAGPVATADPTSATGNRDVATGMDARVSTTGATGGEYFVRVDGVGRGTASTGYTDYGSLGSYTLQVTGCADTSTEQPPSAPLALTGSYLGGGSVSLAWSPPASNGGSAVTGYRVYEDGNLVREPGPSATSARLTGVTPGVRQYEVAAVNALGEGMVASVTVDATDAAEQAKPGRPRIGDVRPGRRGGDRSVVVGWEAPAAEASPAIDGYQIVVFKRRRDGRYAKLGATGLTAPEWRAADVGPLRKGRYKLAVRAHNALGYGKPSARSAAVVAR